MDQAASTSRPNTIVTESHNHYTGPAQNHGRGRGRGRGRARNRGPSRWPNSAPRQDGRIPNYGPITDTTTGRDTRSHAGVVSPAILQSTQNVDQSVADPSGCPNENSIPSSTSYNFNRPDNKDFIRPRRDHFDRNNRAPRYQGVPRPRDVETQQFTETNQQSSDPAQFRINHQAQRHQSRFHRGRFGPGDSNHPDGQHRQRNGNSRRNRHGENTGRYEQCDDNGRDESQSIGDKNIGKLEPVHDNVSDVQKEIAENQFRSNEFECMICCDNIRRYNPIWCCGNCYNIFHLKCAIEWCNKSIKSRNEAISNAQYPNLSTSESGVSVSHTNQPSSSGEGFSGYQSERMKSVEWPCPTCREIQSEKPTKYKCFCGKVVRPDVNKTLTPHSCGQLCGRPRPTLACPHTCNTICHPGKCAPCLLTSRRPCFCGKLISDIKCSQETNSCGQVCGKQLACEKHFCEKVCHHGSCMECEEKLILSCNCGQEVREKPCRELKKTDSKLKFSCYKVCGKLLECGIHYCKDKCHPGPDCKGCPLLSKNIRACPCGSTLIRKSLLNDRKSCKDPIPTCENKCNAVLICGPEKNRHRCQKKCHTGSCPPCKLKSPLLCECKLSTRTVECSLMFKKVVKDEEVYFEQENYKFFCETRCNKPKNCGRHRCNNKCCQARISGGPLHVCEQKCNKKLPCGQHICPETCHQGQCGDCANIGWEELTCHCGMSVLYPPIPCGARPPVCYRPCRRQHPCDHPVKHECHDDNEKCAPCIVFVKKSCFCGSESKENVYCYQSGYSCGKTCKKKLACGQHTCKRVCHDNECESKNKHGVTICNQPCPIARYLCKHPCNLTCHGSTPCPPSECKKSLEVTCECGNKKEKLECHKLMRDYDNRNKVAMLSTSRSNTDSIIIDLSKTPSAKPAIHGSDPTLKQLECDETCSILKRNKALAEALELAQPDLKPVSIFGEDPLRLLREATVQDYKFVASTYSSLARFIGTAKESDKRFTFMQFAPTNKLRREVIHELAHHFNCTSESRDDEPFRHVVVRAYKNKSCVPDFNIEQLLPVSEEFPG